MRSSEAKQGEPSDSLRPIRARQVVGPVALPYEQVEDAWIHCRELLLHDGSLRPYWRWLDRLQLAAFARDLARFVATPNIHDAASRALLERRIARTMSDVLQRRIRACIEADESVAGALASMGVRLQPKVRKTIAFVQCEENELAYQAMKQVARQTSFDIDRFFVFGAVGVGKSLLMRQFQFEREQRFPGERWYVKSGLDHYRAYARAVRDRTRHEFHQQLCTYQGILIEDLHELSGKRRCQEHLVELAELFRARQRLFVGSSNFLAKNTQSFLPGFRSLLNSGLKTFIPRLSQSSREKILQGRLRGLQVPDWYVHKISSPQALERLEECIQRALQVHRFSEQSGRLPAPDELWEIQPRLSQTPRREPMDVLLDRCAEFVGVPRQKILAGHRSRGAALGRHLAIFVAVECLGIQRARLENWFGELASSVVPYARRKIHKLRSSEARIDGFVREVVDELQHGQRLLF